MYPIYTFQTQCISTKKKKGEISNYYLSNLLTNTQICTYSHVNIKHFYKTNFTFHFILNKKKKKIIKRKCYLIADKTMVGRT